MYNLAKTLFTACVVILCFSGSPMSAAEHKIAGGSEMAVPQSNVRGTVFDKFGPVAGASVVIKGTKEGTLTDFDGNFTLNVRKGSILVVSFLGYEDYEIVFNGESELKIEIKESTTVLDEVQVVAYGTAKKATITGSMSSIRTDDLLKTPASSVANALSGKVPGLSTIQMSGQPGADDPTVYIRGVGSLTESLSSPLTLVDGVERSFYQLDPNEIEDITILKDAAATAVFGVRGANGVIIVTTKRGEEGKAKINFSTSFALQTPVRMPSFANSYEYAKTYVEAQKHDGVDESALAFDNAAIEAFRKGNNPKAFPNTDWVNMLIKKVAPQSQHNLTISGGTKKVRYFSSLGYFSQDGLFKSFEKDYNGNFAYRRLNYRVNLDINLTNTTLMRMNIGGRLNDKRAPNYETSDDISYLFRDIYWATPFSGMGIVDGMWLVSDPKRFNLPGDIRDAMYPYYGRGFNVREGNILNFDFMLEQKLDFLTKGLKFHVKGSYNSGLNYTKTFKGQEPRFEAVLQSDNSLKYRKVGDKVALSFSDDTSQSRDWYVEAAFNYKRDFGKHHVSALGMYNQSMKYYQGGNFNSIPRSYIGLVGRLTYNYAMRYMIDANIGYNGSENFAKGKRFGLFPAFSAGWIISEESFMQWMKPFISYMKIRASYGIVGNDRTPDKSRFLYLPDSYNPSSGSYLFGTGLGTSHPGAEESKKGNPDVTWEKSAKQNYGFDINFFNQRLKLVADYFIENRWDILTSRKIIPGYLEVKLPIANIGKVKNHGYEFSLTWRDRISDFNYHIGANVSYAKNEIVFEDEIPYPYDYMRKTGKPVGQQFGRVSDGFFSEQDVAGYEASKGKKGGIPDHGTGFVPKAGDVKYKDLNGDGKIDELDVSAIGYPAYPLLTGGVNMGFSFKGFDFNMTWSGATMTSRYLGDIYREPFGSTNARSLMKYMVTDSWTAEKGNSAKAPAISFTNKTNNYVDSDMWLKDASYIRLKNMEIAYNLPKKALAKMKISSLRFSLSGYNLLTFDKLKIVDPETRANDKSLYPLVTVFNLGAKIGF